MLGFKFRAAALVTVVIGAYAQTTAFVGNIRGSANVGQTLYATTTVSGYFKSVDSGSTWTPFYITEPGLPQPPFAAFAVDPRNESTLYLATSTASGTLWKSTDAAASWSRVNAGLPEAGTAVNTKLFLVSTGDLYLRLDTALYKSTDGAATWTRIRTPLPGNAAHFDVNFTNPRQMIYAALAAVWTSTDEGATWRLSSALQTFGDSVTGAACLASDPMFPNRVYVCVAGPLVRVGNTPVSGLHRSVDGGGSFQPPTTGSQPIGIFVDQTSGPLLFLQGSAGGYCRSADYGQNIRCPADTTLLPEITPTSGRITYLERRNANIVWATAGSRTANQTVMLRSRDAGETWQPVEMRARITLGKPLAPLSMLLAPESTATATLNAAAIDFPTARVAFTATPSGEPWFSVSAVSGTTPANLTVTFRTAGLEPGSRHEGSIRLASAEARNESVSVPVVLQVARPSSGAPPVYEGAVLAGNGTALYPGDGNPATAVGIGDTSALAVDRAKNVYFIGTTHARIRRINTEGRMETVAGNGAVAAAPDGSTALQAPLNSPRGLAIDSGGVVFFGESSVVRRISAGVLGTVVPGTAGVSPAHLALDPQNRLWIAGIGRFSRHVPPSSVANLTLSPPTTIVGPAGFAIDAAGNLYASESGANRVYRITSTGQLSVYAGNGSTVGRDSFPALSTGLESPTALATDRQGNLFILESRQNRIRVVTAAGFLHTVATAESGRTFRTLATDEDGNLYVSAANYIYKFVPRPVLAPSLSGKPRNLASGEESVSPGALFFAEGERLSGGEESAPDEGPWNETLAGSVFTINGRPVPLRRAGPRRLVGQIPFDIQPGAAVARVTSTGVTSDVIPFELLPVSPGIFTDPEDASRAMDAIVGDGEASVLVTGFGPIDPPVAAGASSPGDPVSRASMPFRVTVGEMEAEAIEIVLIPGAPGVGRARFKLPEGVPSGTHLVTIQIGEASSNAVLVTVP